MIPNEKKPKLIAKINKQFTNDKSWTKSKSQIIKDMTTLWAMTVREIGHCEVCGVGNYLEAHHLIERGNHLYRCDKRNGVCLCSSCHVYSAELSAHGRKGGVMSAGERFIQWMKDNKPAQWAWYMNNRDIKAKGTIYEYQYKQWHELLIENAVPVW